MPHFRRVTVSPFYNLKAGCGDGWYKVKATHEGEVLLSRVFKSGLSFCALHLSAAFSGGDTLRTWTKESENEESK